MEAHGHGHGKDHVPHILPFATYLKTLVTLLVLTAVTVGVSYVNFGGANLWIALIVATVKASVVALVFMHLFWDHRFHSIILVMAALFLAVFIAFTMFDTQTRGGGGEVIRGERPADVKVPFAGTRGEAEIKAKWGAPGASGTPSAAPTTEPAPKH